MIPALLFSIYSALIFTRLKWIRSSHLISDRFLATSSQGHVVNYRQQIEYISLESRFVVLFGLRYMGYINNPHLVSVSTFAKIKEHHPKSSKAMKNGFKRIEIPFSEQCSFKIIVSECFMFSIIIYIIFKFFKTIVVQIFSHVTNVVQVYIFSMGT